VRRVVLVVIALLLGCQQPPRAPQPARPDVDLVVLLVIDQLPVWAFDRDRPLYRGGLARLLREGAYAVAELPHANTFTAPGHATIGTGAPPSIHGVIGNQWYRRDELRALPAEHDPEAAMFSVIAPEMLAEVASAKALRVDGLADVLREATHGRARSVAIALKARAATMVAGRRPDLAVWFDADAGGMTTSRGYADAPPSWLLELARARPAARFVGQTWAPLDRELLARATQIDDDGPGEATVHGLGIGFPHVIAELGAIVRTPFGDDVVLDAALAAIDALELGDDDVPDLLAVSFNAHDYAGHTWGPDSWESLDLTLRLDDALGRLFEALDREVGASRWAVVLTSDHGATPLVERGGVADARRIPTMEVAAAIDDALAARLGPGPWVQAVLSNQVYLAPRWHQVDATLRDAALEEAADAIARLRGIAGVYRADRTTGACEARDGLERAVCYALADEASGDLYLVPARGSLITDYPNGTHHDAPNDDNRKVPILVRAPGLAPHVTQGSLLQVAPTVSALLGVPPPPAATAPPLFGLAPVPAR